MMPAQDVDLTAEDGTKLHAWYLHPMGWSKEARRQRPTVLFFQENAGSMTFRLPFLKLLARYLDCSIFAPRCEALTSLAACHEREQSMMHQQERPVNKRQYRNPCSPFLDTRLLIASGWYA